MTRRLCDSLSLSTHYRSPIEFSDEQLKEAEVSIDRYYTTLTRIADFLSMTPSLGLNPPSPFRKGARGDLKRH